MKAFKLPALLASLLLISSVAMAQTPAKPAGSEAGPNLTQKPDPNKPPNARAAVKAEVKSDMSKGTMPNEYKQGQVEPTGKAIPSTTSRADVKADAKQPGKTKETEAGPVPTATASDMAATKAKRAERKADRKAKRDAKMKAMEKPAA